MKNKKNILSISLIIILGILFIYQHENLLSNNKIEWGYYLNNEKITNMPKFKSDDGIFFEHAECNNGASIGWDNERWGPIIKNLNTSNTKCSLYFVEKNMEIAGKKVNIVKSGDGLYEVSHNDLEELGQEWNKTEYRYAGINPDNYVRFNNEIWRIIGLVNVKVGDNIEQRVKILRIDGVGEQKDNGHYIWDTDTNNWATSKLKDMLNGIYYESGIGDCYTYKGLEQCDFSGNGDLPKGLDETARNMIDKEVIWNIGGSNTYKDLTVKMVYERERSTITENINQYPAEWSNETDVGEKHNGIGLIYPSDFGYATNGGSLGREACFNGYLDRWDNVSPDNISKNYKDECIPNDWIYNDSYISTLLPYNNDYVFQFSSLGGLTITVVERSNGSIWPVVYLTTSTKIIDGNGTLEEPFALSVQN